MEALVNRDEIANNVSMIDSASQEESLTVIKADKRRARMSTSKSCFEQLRIEMKKRQKLMKEKEEKSRRKKEVDYSKTCLRQYNSYIQRIANCVDDILPLIKNDLSLSSGHIICCVCFKALSRKFWQQHVISKHFYRLYKCLYCDYACSLFNNLKRHTRIVHESSITVSTRKQAIEDESSEDDWNETVLLQT